ncbi:peptidylprolyl isomerase [Euzebya sp.]|uniref:peptidylprolyl isomerase n=1 Tax=Euzebya sp. TaxID=1971409 RepID=UPI003518C1B1
MSGSQKKKAEKARRRAEREKARKAERRRNVMTGIIVGVIVLLGGLMVALSLEGDDDVDLEQLASEAEASASEALAAGSEGPLASEDAASEAAGASEGASEAAGEVVPDDPEAEPGAPVDAAEAPVEDTERPVACGAEEPENAFDTRPQYPGGPAEVLEEGVDYRAVIETSCGTVEMDLLEDAAPETVNSFVFLAQEGFFDGLEVFRNATSIGALQTGGGNQSNSWSIGYNLPDELGLAESEGYPVGSVAMANAGPNTGGSQFFFIYDGSFQAGVEGGQLQPSYAVFAEVTEGLDVLEDIGAIETTGPQNETPTERVYMESVTIEER